MQYTIMGALRNIFYCISQQIFWKCGHILTKCYEMCAFYTKCSCNVQCYNFWYSNLNKYNLSMFIQYLAWNKKDDTGWVTKDNIRPDQLQIWWRLQSQNNLWCKLSPQRIWSKQGAKKNNGYPCDHRPAACVQSYQL